MSIYSPCKNCNERFCRTEGNKIYDCHSVCEKYKQFEHDRKEYLEKVRKQKMLENAGFNQDLLKHHKRVF